MQDGPAGLPVTIIPRDHPQVGQQRCTDTSASCAARWERIQLMANVPLANDLPLLRLMSAGLLPAELSRDLCIAGEWVLAGAFSTISLG